MGSNHYAVGAGGLQLISLNGPGALCNALNRLGSQVRAAHGHAVERANEKGTLKVPLWFHC
jgi:hypothetical protein